VKAVAAAAETARGATVTDLSRGAGARIAFEVPGLPESKGSWRALAGGRVKADNAREKAWAAAVGWAAKIAMRAKPMMNSALVAMDFRLPPPIGRKHKRDADKLVRSVLDALTGIVYVDDENVSCIVATKEVTTRAPGVDIVVFEPLGVRATQLIRFWLEKHEGRPCGV
jgi:Holliday junction resolvase RusA-like endonuclease